MVALQRLRTATYTFEDFLARLHRSRASDIPRMYVANKALFAQREDMLHRSLRELPWEKATRLAAAAHFHQPLSVDTYRTLLATMLVHNTTAESRQSSAPLVDWRVALRVVSEAYVAHGTTAPSRVSVSGMRLLRPHRQWMQAVRLLQFAQRNEQLTTTLALDAAAACAAPSSWRMAMHLLMRVHLQAPELLVGAITSMLPENPNAPYALLKQPSRSPESLRVLGVIGRVVGSVPPTTLLHNEMCLSYITHLCNSPDLFNAQRLEEAVGGLSWRDALVLLGHASLSPANVLVPLLRPEPSVALLSSRPQQDGGVGDTATSPTPLGSAAAPATDVITQRHMNARLLAAIVRRLPSSKSVAQFLDRLPSERSVVEHHQVIAARLDVSVRDGNWEEALGLLASLPFAMSSTVVDDLRSSIGAAHALIDLLRSKEGVPTAVSANVATSLLQLGIRLDAERLRKLFELLLLHNSKKPQPTMGPIDDRTPWSAALGWAFQLSDQQGTTSIQETHGTAARSVAAPLNPAMASLLVHLCVQGGSPQGALRTINYFHTNNLARFESGNEMKALLFCMMYHREREANMIVATAATRNPVKAKPLIALLERWQWCAPPDDAAA